MNIAKPLSRIFFIGIAASMLTACLATLPESVNALLGTKSNTDTAGSTATSTTTSSVVAKNPESVNALLGTKSNTNTAGSTATSTTTSSVVAKKLAEGKRTAIPAGIFTESYDNGDDFLEIFRFEDYMPAAYSSTILSKMTVFRAGDQKYANDFERNLAVRKAQNSQPIMKSQDKQLPEYLAFKVAFDISPKNYLFDRGGFYLKPTYDYLPFSDHRRLNHKSIADSNIVARPGGRDVEIYWGYAQERDYTGNNYGFDTHRTKSANYFENYSVQLTTSIKVGYLEERTLAGSYSSRKSNEYIRIKVSQSQFSDILKGGYPVGNSIGSVFYVGYVLVKIDKQSFTCRDTVDMKGAYVRCALRVNPVKYVINNFLGKEQYITNPEAIDLINDKTNFDRLQ